MSLCPRRAGGNFLAAVCVGGPAPLLPGARWPLGGVWGAGAAPSEGVGWLVLVRPSVSVHCFEVVVCCGAPCCVVLVFAVLRCVLLGRVVLRCVVPWCAALCRVALRRAVACCA